MSEFPVYRAEDIRAVLPPEPKAQPKAKTSANNSRRHSENRHQIVDRARNYLAAIPGAISGCGGNNHTYKAAAKLRDLGTTEGEAFELMLEWNARCEPPWDEPELRQIVTNVWRYAQNEPGSKLAERIQEAPSVPDGSNGDAECDEEREAIRDEGAGPDQVPTGEEEPAFITPPHWKRLDLADLDNWDCEPLVPIIDKILARGNVCYVAAETQTGKTLMWPYVGRKILHLGKLYERFDINPVNRVGYFVLEDPARRIQDRMKDTAHEFPTIERRRFIFRVAPGFNLTDERMFQWLESVIDDDKLDVLFLDTYQKATPGIASFDDEKQSVILHRLADLTRRLGITLVILDHVRKRQNSSKRTGEISIDDIKGTGGKAQNADCVILMERTADKKQIRFQCFSKDFDQPVRILLNVAPKGSTEPKFTYAANLDELGAESRKRGEENRNKVLASMTPGEWMPLSEIVAACGMKDATVRRHLKTLITTGVTRRAEAGCPYRVTSGLNHTDV